MNFLLQRIGACDKKPFLLQSQYTKRELECSQASLNCNNIKRGNGGWISSDGTKRMIKNC